MARAAFTVAVTGPAGPKFNATLPGHVAVSPHVPVPLVIMYVAVVVFVPSKDGPLTIEHTLPATIAMFAATPEFVTAFAVKVALNGTGAVGEVVKLTVGICPTYKAVVADVLTEKFRSPLYAAVSCV